MEKEIKILYVPIQGEPEEKTVANKLEAFQSLVGGNIEMFPIDDDHSIFGVCNEEGKINRMLPNRLLIDFITDKVIDIVFGNFFIVGYDGKGDFCSLTSEEVSIYKDMLTPHVCYV